jgi:hypothetical protein
MRKVGYLIIIFLPMLGLLACQQVQKPELKGEGPLAVIVARGTATPEYHAPRAGHQPWRFQQAGMRPLPQSRNEL